MSTHDGDPDEGTKRKKVQTKEGMQYQVDLVNSMINEKKSGVLRKIEEIRSIISDESKLEVILKEEKVLDDLFDGLLEVVARRRDLEISSTQEEILTKETDKIDSEVFAIKRRISHLTTSAEIKEKSLSQKSKSILDLANNEHLGTKQSIASGSTIRRNRMLS